LHCGGEEVALDGGDAAGRLGGEDVDAEDVVVGFCAVLGDLGPTSWCESLFDLGSRMVN